MKGAFNATLDALSFINPLSENFFLWVAFVPSDNFLSEYGAKYQTLAQEKFGVVYQLRDTLNAFQTAVSAEHNNEFQITADLSKYGIGEVEVINGQAIKAYGDKLKFWIGGLMMFLTGAWLFRKMTGLIGEGK